MSIDSRPPVIAIMGPTASGKTAFAVECARALDGEIISVDSALVYRGLDIGAAKPTLEERRGVPHHLIDVRDPWEPCSAAEFAIDARAALDAIAARGRLPILAGGTGLYFQALLRGLSAMPAADPDVRAQLAQEAGHRGWAALHAELAQVDPEAARRIHATDAQRIQRALEVYRLLDLDNGVQLSPCNFTKGASGGPWIVGLRNNLGNLIGVNSLTWNRDAKGEFDAVSSPYFGAVAGDVYRHAAAQKTPANVI